MTGLLIGVDAGGLGTDAAVEVLGAAGVLAAGGLVVLLLLLDPQPAATSAVTATASSSSRLIRRDIVRSVLLRSMAHPSGIAALRLRDPTPSLRMFEVGRVGAGRRIRRGGCPWGDTSGVAERNIEIVKRLYDAWANDDFPGPAELLSPEIEYVNHEDAVEPGTRQGLDEFKRAVEKVR